MLQSIYNSRVDRWKHRTVKLDSISYIFVFETIVGSDGAKRERNLKNFKSRVERS